MQVKLIFMWKTRFETEAHGNSEMTYQQEAIYKEKFIT